MTSACSPISSTYYRSIGTFLQLYAKKGDTQRIAHSVDEKNFYGVGEGVHRALQ